jgi:hypothetical protein
MNAAKTIASNGYTMLRFITLYMHPCKSQYETGNITKKTYISISSMICLHKGQFAENISMVYVVSYICYNVFEGYNPLAAVMRSVIDLGFYHVSK